MHTLCSPRHVSHFQNDFPSYCLKLTVSPFFQNTNSVFPLSLRVRCPDTPSFNIEFGSPRLTHLKSLYSVYGQLIQPGFFFFLAAPSLRSMTGNALPLSDAPFWFLVYLIILHSLLVRRFHSPFFEQEDLRQIAVLRLTFPLPLVVFSVSNTSCVFLTFPLCWVRRFGESRKKQAFFFFLSPLILPLPIPHGRLFHFKVFFPAHSLSFFPSQGSFFAADRLQ